MTRAAGDESPLTPRALRRAAAGRKLVTVPFDLAVGDEDVGARQLTFVWDVHIDQYDMLTLDQRRQLVGADIGPTTTTVATGPAGRPGYAPVGIGFRCARCRGGGSRPAQ